MANKGFIYILYNPATPLLKIGKTQRTSELRAMELSRQAGTGLPAEYVVAYDVEVSDCTLVEKLVHKKLDKYRYMHNREFFNYPLKKCIGAIEEVIKDLEKDHTINVFSKNIEELTTQEWWNNLSFIWHQIFRKHSNFTYHPEDIDLYRAVHNVIDHCQNENLRKKVCDLIADKKFTKKIVKWYNSLEGEKNLFNSYLPYMPSEQEILQIFKIRKIDCGNNIAVIDFNPLEKLTHLREINAINTFVSDLKPLATLSKLEEICVNYTQVDNLSPLDKLPNLRKVSCYGTELTAEEIDRFSNLTGCEVITDIFLSSDIPVKVAKKIK